MGEMNHWHEDLDSDLVPRPKRRVRRAKCDRGLPPDQELARLAEEYLTTQSKLWPELAKAGIIPPVSDAILKEMCEDFKSRHRTGKTFFQFPESSRFIKLLLGASYNRYSCDNSEPTSIIDQLHNCLHRAHQDVRFIPWSYVLCDYSVSGLSSSRQGYTSLKCILADKLQAIETIYVDDFTRASRDEMEWWRLAYLAKRLQKRMIGASDGFDLSAPDWDVKITIYGLISRLFIKSLREKVKRGMKGAARRKKCLGRPPLGFTRRVLRDAGGQVVRNAQGVPNYEWAWDECTKQLRQEMSEMFGIKRLTTYQIMKHFNVNRYDDWSGWTETGINNLLKSPSSIGVFIWNQYSNVRDYETGKTIRVKNPRDQWEVVYQPELAIIPIELWRTIRRRVSEIERKSADRPRASRNQIRATTLFSGTLFCAHCQKEITLIRSTTKYKVFGCLNGTNHAHGCQLTTSKSTRIVEECLLGYLSNQLLTDDVIKDLVQKANGILIEESKKPAVADAPIKAKLKREENAIKKLLGRLENQESDELCQVLEKRIIEHQKLVNNLKTELGTIERANRKPPSPLNLNSVLDLLKDVRGLLNQDIPVAAEAIRSITGPITIHHQRKPGQTRGATWVASFSPDLLGFLCKVAKGKNYPDSITLEYIKSGKWIIPQPVEITIQYVTQSLRFHSKVKDLARNGASKTVIATALGISPDTVKLALNCPGTAVGSRGKKRIRKSRKSEQPAALPKYKQIAEEVVRLREEKNLSFSEIVRRLKASQQTVARAFDFLRPTSIQLASTTGNPPKRGRYTHLPKTVFDEVENGIKSQNTTEEIAARAGCSASTVRRAKRERRRKEAA